jgi:hypothetical protein
MKTGLPLLVALAIAYAVAVEWRTASQTPAAPAAESPTR